MRTIRLLSLLLCTASCAPFAGLQARPGTLGGPALPSATPRDAVRSEFLAELATSPSGSEAREAADSAGVSGKVRLVVLPDDTFEYQLTILRADSVIFTTGELFRVSDAGEGDPVATLFSEVSLTGPYVQLRGTGQVARSLRASALLDEIRQAPASFVVRISAEPGRRVSLAGPLR